MASPSITCVGAWGVRARGSPGTPRARSRVASGFPRARFARGVRCTPSASTSGPEFVGAPVSSSEGGATAPAVLDEKTRTSSTEENAGSVLSNVLAGLTTSLAMVPEALAFTFVAGVSPIVGLHTAMVMALVAALTGSQPGIISGAAGATAVVLAPLVASHGTAYMCGAVVLAGILQGLAGWARLGKFIRLVPRPAMLGFVNGLGLVIGLAQFEQFKTHSGAWIVGLPLATMVGLTALTMALVWAWPKFVTKKVPAPLASIAIVTALVKFVPGLNTRTLGDIASLKGGLPGFSVPDVPLTLETLGLLFPVAAGIAAVGLIETLLTQQLVDEVTGVRSETHIECVSQGAANLVTGFLGGMGGCAMIGQSVINVSAGGRTRLSGITCALALALYVLVGSSAIASVPLAALVGVMWSLVVDIVDWASFSRASRMPKTDAAVMVMVTAVTYLTNLAVAVFAGVILSSLGFAWKSALRGVYGLRSVEPYEGGSAAVYRLSGPLFFGSVQTFVESFAVRAADEPEKTIVLDFVDARVWDSSAVEAIVDVARRFESDSGRKVHLRHLSRDCRALLIKAGCDVEVNMLEDPTYSPAVDYPASSILA